MQEVNLDEVKVDKYYFIYSKFHESLCKKDSNWTNYRKIIAKIKSKTTYCIDEKCLYKVIFTDVMHIPSKISSVDYHFIFREDRSKNSEIIYKCTQHPYKCCDNYYNRVLNLLLYKITGERNFNLTYF